MLKKYTLLLIISVSALKGKSQLIDKAIHNNYSSSIVVKVYEIASKINLNKTQQILLANHFVQFDKLKAESILQNKSLRYLDSLEKVSNNKWRSILSIDQKDNWFKDEAENFALTASKGEMNFINKMYQPDSLLSVKLKNIYYNKYKSLYKQYFTLDLQASISRIEYFNSLYDSSLYKIFSSFYSARFINDYISKLQHISSVQDSQILKIKKYALGQLLKHQDQNINNILLEATQFFLPDTAVFKSIYGEEIQKRTLTLTVVEKLNLSNVYRVPQHSLNSIHDLIKKKAYYLSLSEYTYAAFPHERDINIINISRFYDSLIVRALIQDGVLLSQNQFSIAVRYKDILGIHPSLIDTLIQHGIFLTQKRDSILNKDPFAKIDFKAYESKHLNLLLNEEQYTKLLYIKNRSQVEKDSQENWEELILRKLANGIDKEKTIDVLNQYYLAKWNVYYRWAHDRLKQEAHLRLLKENQPKILKSLNAAQKQLLPLNENINLKYSSNK